MTGCYIDESGTDSNLPVAVVAGLMLDSPGYFWLDVEWVKILKRHRIDGPIHMREFTPNGEFRGMSHTERRALFIDLAAAINEHKLMSLASTLTAEQYRKHFKDVKKFSMYAACFTNFVMLSGTGLKVYGSHRWPLSYFLDDGNTYKSQVVESRPRLIEEFPRIAAIDFLCDSQVNALQAADALSWAVRRSSTGTLAHGMEPLSGLFDIHHVVLDYKEEWMQEVADKVRAKESVDNSPAQ